MTGAPTSEAQVRYAMELVNEASTAAVPLVNDVGSDMSFEFLQVEHFERDDVQLYGLTEQQGSRFAVTIALRGKECLADTALIHELLHIRYGDAEHKNPFVWHATLVELNNKLITRFCPGRAQDGGLH